MRILVVDDEDNLRRMMRLTLEASGYQVAEAPNGEEGLKQFGDGLQFDATLLDQRMPGMDGLETLRRMKLQRAEACVIMVTAYATIELAVDAMKLGATDFVRKPMTPDTLRHAVAAALAKRDRSTSRAVPERPPTQAVPSSDRQQQPPVEIWTTNGFFVARATGQRAAGEPPAAEYHFVVRRGKDGAGADVVVSVDPKTMERIARERKRPLGPASAFWRQQAESALVNYLWNEAELPEAGHLVVNRVTAAMLDAAVDWPED